MIDRILLKQEVDPPGVANLDGRRSMFNKAPYG